MNEGKKERRKEREQERKKKFVAPFTGTSEVQMNYRLWKNR